MFQIPIADPSLAHRSLPRQKIPCKLEKQFQKILIFYIIRRKFCQDKDTLKLSGQNTFAGI